MSTEPEKNMDGLLNAYAGKRRAEAGPPLEMHPATRQLLQAEVARTFPKQPRRTSWFGLLTEFWPRLAWGGSVLALVAAGSLVWLRLEKAGPDRFDVAQRTQSEPLRVDLDQDLGRQQDLQKAQSGAPDSALRSTTVTATPAQKDAPTSMPAPAPVLADAMEKTPEPSKPGSSAPSALAPTTRRQAQPPPALLSAPAPTSSTGEAASRRFGLAPERARQQARPSLNEQPDSTAPRRFDDKPKQKQTLAFSADARPSPTREADQGAGASKPSEPAAPTPTRRGIAPSSETAVARAPTREADRPAKAQPSRYGLKTTQPEGESNKSITTLVRVDESRRRSEAPTDRSAASLPPDNRVSQRPAVATEDLQAAPSVRLTRSEGLSEPTAKVANYAIVANNLATGLAGGGSNTLRFQFTQSDARARYRQNFNSPPVPNVLQAFEMQSDGNNLQVTDADGSVYVGTIQSVLANVASVPASAQPDTPSKGVTIKKTGTAPFPTQPDTASQPFRNQDQALSSEFFSFQAVGTNRSLNQRVVFVGNFQAVTNDAAANTETRFGERDPGRGGGAQSTSRMAIANLPGGAQASRPSGPPTSPAGIQGGTSPIIIRQLLQNQNQIFANGRIEGRAVIGSNNEVKIQAVQVGP